MKKSKIRRQRRQEVRGSTEPVQPISEQPPRVLVMRLKMLATAMATADVLPLSVPALPGAQFHWDGESDPPRIASVSVVSAAAYARACALIAKEYGA